MNSHTQICRVCPAKQRPSPHPFLIISRAIEPVVHVMYAFTHRTERQGGDHVDADLWLAPPSRMSPKEGGASRGAPRAHRFV